MFFQGNWAKAFVNSIEKAGGEIEEAIETLKILSAWVKSLPGEVSGSSGAEKLEALLRKTFPMAAVQETTLRFLLLTVKKDAFFQIDSILAEIKKTLDKKRAIIAASLEYAFEPEEELKSHLVDTIKKVTGAAGVELSLSLNPALIGGYRLKIGDKIIDSSIKTQLQKMKASLAEDGGY